MSVEHKLSLAGRHAFILGGTGGLGRETSKALGLRGAYLDIHGRNPDKLAETLDEFHREGLRAEGTADEIKTLEDALPLLERAAKADILVAAWGPFLQKPLQETPLEDWRRVADFNLALPGALASAAIPGMKNRGWGRILVFGGTRTDGIRGFRTNAAYAAAKTGLGVLVKSIAAEYARFGIAALALCPGFADTEYLSPGQAKDLAARAPRGRMTEPGDIGDFAADLLFREPPLWNGAIFTADEGLFSW